MQQCNDRSNNTESKNKFASLLQSFWLRKNDMDLNGLLSLEHELYIKKNEYLTYFLEYKNQKYVS